MTEDDLIARHFAPLAGPGGLGLLDDAATIPAPAGRDLVLTADALVAGVHFFADDPAGAIGWKALAVNLSDLAAKGARPEGFLLSLALPGGTTDAWLQAFAAGLGALAAQGGCPLLGGDTVRMPGPLTLSITAIGSVPAGRMVRRTGARPGDAIYVSGTIGDSALGLALRTGPAPWSGTLSGEQAAFLADRYLHPQPRGPLAGVLQSFASGGMDVSDGLVGDLSKMMRACGAGARVELDAVPLSGAVAAACGAEPSLFERAVTGGDDYEILATVPEAVTGLFEAAARQSGVEVRRIGAVLAAGEGISFLRGGAPVSFARGSFSHF